MAKTEQDPKANPNQLSAQSAYKALEMVLYNLSSHINDSVNSIEKETQSADNITRIKVSQLKESLNQLELFISDSLLKKSVQKDANNFDTSNIERIKVDKVLRTLARTSSSENIQQFFNYCVQNLADFYGSKYAFIGLLKENRKQVRTLSVWAEDHIVDNFEYDLEGTPCAEIINMDKELIPENASSLYAEDEMLVNMGIDSYYGSPLISDEEGVIGLVSVMDVKPMVLNEWSAPTLGVFSSRITVEIQRNQIMTDLKLLNETLEERIENRTADLKNANDELSAFSYSVSHDLRAPVRTIKSFTDIMKEDYANELSDGATELLNRIESAGKRMDDIIEGLLKLANITRNKITRQKINLSQLITEEIDLAIKTGDPQRILETNITPDIHIWADINLVKIAIQNLISNAYKYTANKDSTEIHFGISKSIKSDDPVYYIKDNGAGFDMSYYKNIFKPFSRLHSDREFSGLGIGLATTKKIFERHKGDIWAESSKDDGAIFYFTFGEYKPIN